MLAEYIPKRRSVVLTLVRAYYVGIWTLWEFNANKLARLMRSVPNGHDKVCDFQAIVRDTVGHPRNGILFEVFSAGFQPWSKTLSRLLMGIVWGGIV